MSPRPLIELQGITRSFGEGELAVPVLKGIDLKVWPGEFVAIMGPSGSGKTSFLNVLAGRVPVGSTLRGSVRVNGKAVSGRFPEGSAYVMQDDALFSCLSVRETMYYAADLRLPPANSSEKKREIAEAVITELGLLKCADTHIGNEFKKGVSGGERKRMSRFLAFQAADFGDACCTADGPEGRGGPPALIVD